MNLVRKVRTFLKESLFFIKHGFAPAAWYGFCDHWALKMLPALQYYRNHVNGHPGVFESVGEWQVVLDKMIFALHETATDEAEMALFDKYRGGKPFQFNRVQTEEEKAEYAALQARVAEGLSLFGQHYARIWD